MRKRFMTGIAALTAAAMLASGGCGLLPEEEQAPTPPLIYSYEKTDYTFANVVYGDIVESQRFTFKYRPAMQESLSFGVQGYALAGVYVSTGDIVEAGDLLAELDDGGLSDRIEAQRDTIAAYERSLKDIDSRRALELEGYDIRISADPENESLKSARASAVENYAAERKTTELRLSAAESRLDELLSDVSKFRLYAPFGGTVTYIKNFGTSGFSSVAGEAFITISDKTTMAFSCDASETEGLFAVGDSVNLSMDGEPNPATVVSVEGKLVSIEPNEYIPGITEGSYGVVTIVTEAAYDVLCVPSGAVKSANGQDIVYILDDNGVRVMREVETGFAADGLVEITSGLEEGEQVIVS